MKAALRESRPRAVRSMQVQRCGRKSHRGGENASKAKAVGRRKQYVDIREQFLEFSRTSLATTASLSPSRLNHAAMRTQALRIDCQVSLDNDSEEACEINVDKDRTMPGLAHHRTGCVWHVRYDLHDRFEQDGHQVVDDGSERRRCLDGPCDSRG